MTDEKAKGQGGGDGQGQEREGRLEHEAYCAALEVLSHDLCVVRLAREGGDGQKPSEEAVERALDRLARMGAKRVPMLVRSLEDGEIMARLEAVQDRQDGGQAYLDRGARRAAGQFRAEDETV